MEILNTLTSTGSKFITIISNLLEWTDSIIIHGNKLTDTTLGGLNNLVEATVKEATKALTSTDLTELTSKLKLVTNALENYPGDTTDERYTQLTSLKAKLIDKQSWLLIEDNDIEETDPKS